MGAGTGTMRNQGNGVGSWWLDVWKREESEEAMQYLGTPFLERMKNTHTKTTDWNYLAMRGGMISPLFPILSCRRLNHLMKLDQTDITRGWPPPRGLVRDLLVHNVHCNHEIVRHFRRHLDACES